MHQCAHLYYDSVSPSMEFLMQEGDMHWQLLQSVALKRGTLNFTQNCEWGKLPINPGNSLIDNLALQMTIVYIHKQKSLANNVCRFHLLLADCLLPSFQQQKKWY